MDWVDAEITTLIAQIGTPPEELATKIHKGEYRLPGACADAVGAAVVTKYLPQDVRDQTSAVIAAERSKVDERSASILEHISTAVQAWEGLPLAERAAKAHQTRVRVLELAHGALPEGQGRF